MHPEDDSLASLDGCTYTKVVSFNNWVHQEACRRWEIIKHPLTDLRVEPLWHRNEDVIEYAVDYRFARSNPRWHEDESNEQDSNDNYNDSVADHCARLIKEDGYFYCEDPHDSGAGGQDPDEDFFYPLLHSSLTTTIDKTSFEAFSKMNLRKHGPETENPAIKRLWRSHKNGKHVVLFIPPTQCAGLKIKGTQEVTGYVLFRHRLVHATKSNGTFPPWFPDDPKIQYYFDVAKRSVTINYSGDKSLEDPV
ncbi:hypothetical protein FPHYL_4255 [Fusarium phyllophilum]|uniref:Uncharacterized protein n=1 Tax=Fusarium phyllophilum TaxID=47803 RepID=A0A8H5K340_9HYPO|nr:hypothetical protein FPHYL_4255 [Fusarium phyllophilum]